MIGLLVVILIVLIPHQNPVKAAEALIVNRNSSINTKYSSIISRNNIHIYQFSIPSNISNFAVQSEVSSTNLSETVFIYAEHGTYIESWHIPFRNQFYSDSIIPSSSNPTCPQAKNQSTQDISIRFQTFSYQPIIFSLTIASIQSNILELGREVTTSISLTSPQFFAHDFPDDLQFLEFQLSSPSQLCVLARFTSYSCPPDFTLRAGRGVNGFELTMLTLANLRIRREDFAGGRVMILLIPIPAAQCETTLEYDVNATSENFEKNITLVSKPGNPNFWGPILILLIIFVIPYIMFAIIIGFDLIIGHFYPKSNKHLAIFTSVRRYADDASFEQIDHSAHETNVELGEVKKDDENPQTENEISEVHTIGRENQDIIEAYKNSLMDGTLSSGVKNAYYYSLINSKDINVRDLHLNPDSDSRKIVALYPYTVMIIGLFYFLPALQVSYVNYEQLLATGSLDICYINYRCERNAGQLRPFNSVWSNIGYFLLSILFFIIVFIKQRLFTSEVKAKGYPTRGIPQTFSLYYAVALALFFESILSSIYHLCPSMTNFQFDSTFQYVFLVLLSVRMYQNRHPDANLKPSHVFHLLSICVIFTSLSLFRENSSDYPARIVLTLGFTVVTGILLYLVYNLYIPQLPLYYYRAWKKKKSIVRTHQQIFCPKYNKTRIFQMIGFIAAVVMIIIVIWTPGILTTVATGILLGITLNIMFYYLYYWIMKLVHKEFLHRPFVFTIALALLIVSVICWGFAFYFWYTLRGSWSVSPALARERLTDCIFLDYFDDHDMWHIMSSFGIFTLYLSTLLVDENLSFVPQDKIRVF